MLNTLTRPHSSHSPQISSNSQRCFGLTADSHSQAHFRPRTVIGTHQKHTQHSHTYMQTGTTYARVHTYLGPQSHMCTQKHIYAHMHTFIFLTHGEGPCLWGLGKVHPWACPMGLNPVFLHRTPDSSLKGNEKGSDRPAGSL